MLQEIRHNRVFKTIAIGVVCLFLANTTFQGISYADIYPGKACDTLAPNSKLHGPRNPRDISRFIQEAVEVLGKRGRTPEQILETIDTWLKASPYTLQEGNVQSVEFDSTRPEDGRFKVTLVDPS